MHRVPAALRRLIDVWDPVICSDGQVYGNSCYAYVACATGCQSYGSGGPVSAE